jgi:hypothetical protein
MFAHFNFQSRSNSLRARQDRTLIVAADHEKSGLRSKQFYRKRINDSRIREGRMKGQAGPVPL